MPKESHRIFSLAITEYLLTAIMLSTILRKVNQQQDEEERTEKEDWRQVGPCKVSERVEEASCRGWPWTGGRQQEKNSREGSGWMTKWKWGVVSDQAKGRRELKRQWDQGE